MSKYDITVSLVGKDGNAYRVLGAVTQQMKKHGVPPEEIAEFKEEAMSGDYDHLLRTTMDWVNVI